MSLRLPCQPHANHIPTSTHARAVHAAAPALCAALTAFVLRSVSPPSWTCMHGETATFWPTVVVRKEADCTYKLSSRDGVIASYPTTTAKVAFLNDQGAWVPWRDFSYDVSFSVGSADGYCGATSHGKPYACAPSWASFQRLLAFGLPALDYSNQIYGVSNVKTDKLTIAPVGTTGFTVRVAAPCPLQSSRCPRSLPAPHSNTQTVCCLAGASHGGPCMHARR